MLTSGFTQTPPPPTKIPRSPLTAKMAGKLPADTMHMRTPTRIPSPPAHTSSSAPTRATGQKILHQIHFASPQHSQSLGLSSTSPCNPGNDMHPTSSINRQRDSRRPTLQRRYNSTATAAAYRNPAGGSEIREPEPTLTRQKTTAPTVGTNTAIHAKDSRAFPSSTLAQHFGSRQEVAPRSREQSRQTKTNPESPSASAFTFRFSDKAAAASTSNTRAPEMPANSPRRVGFASPSVREGKQRAATTTTTTGTSGAQLGLPGRSRRPSVGQGYLQQPGQIVSIDECSERLDRLLQRVHNANLEHDAFKALMSPTAPMTPTRLDPTPPPSSPPLLPPPQLANCSSDSSTVSTVSVGIDSNHSAKDIPSEAGKATEQKQPDCPYSPRRRAVTMDPQLGSGAKRNPNNTAAGRTPSSIRARAEELRARRLAREAEEERAAAEGRQVTSPLLSPIIGGTKPRANTDFITQRGTQFNVSSGSETAIDCPLGDEDPDFFDNKEAMAMFREIPLPFKELDWEKQVYYHHVARTNEDYRKATEDVEIRDCRAECLVDLIGEKAAARVLARDREKPSVLRRQRGSGDDVQDGGDYADMALCSSAGTDDDDLMTWLDSDGDEDESERSFDWSRDGFGYMEFRRNSRMSLGKSSVLSPVGAGLNGSRLLANDAASGTSPIARPLAKLQKQSPLHMPPASPVRDTHTAAADKKLSEAVPPMAPRQPSSSRVDGKGRSNSGSGKELISKMRGSMDRLVPQRWRGNTPVASGQTHQRNKAGHALSLIKESDDGWQVFSHAASSNASVADARQELKLLEAENRRLEQQVSKARMAINSLTRLVVKLM